MRTVKTPLRARILRYFVGLSVEHTDFYRLNRQGSPLFGTLGAEGLRIPAQLFPRDSGLP
jgi:hypothetical protein